MAFLSRLHTWRRTLVVLLATLAFALLVCCPAARSFTPARGLAFEVFDEPDLTGNAVLRTSTDRIDSDAIQGPWLPTHDFSARWTGWWLAPRAGRYTFRLAADDEGRLVVDGEEILRRDASVGFATAEKAVDLVAGLHSVEVTYAQRGGGAFVAVAVAMPDRAAAPFDRDRLFDVRPTPAQVHFRRLAATGSTLLWTLWAAVAGLTLLAHLDEFARLRWSVSQARALGARAVRTAWLRRAATVAALATIVLLATVLHFDAVFGSVGPVEQPSWARALHYYVSELAPHVRPARVRWTPVDTPYVGGDPINYLANARAFSHFYQAHVREPVFVALTRGFLELLDDQDVAISFASAASAVLLVVATFLLGRVAFGAPVGLLAALFMSIELVSIAWSTEGWRDETSALSSVLGTCALLWLSERPGLTSGVAAGVTGAVAALTRITALGAWLPGLLFAALDNSGRSWRARVLAMALAGLVCGGLVAPYLVACARAFGDPLYAINQHTGIYRSRSGLPSDHPQSAAAYLGERVRTQLFQTADTIVYGVTVYPFANKWTGFAPWWRPLQVVLPVAALLGLATWPLSRHGRLLLVSLAGSLLPFAVGWRVTGGAEWRYTLVAYPYYLVAASWTLIAAVSALVTLGPGGTLLALRGWARDNWRGLAAVATAVTLVAGALAVLPWAAMREALARGAPVVIVPDERSGPVFRAGWTPLVPGQCIGATRTEADLSVSLPPPGPYLIAVQLVSLQMSLAPPNRLLITGPNGELLSSVPLRPDDRNQRAEFLAGRELVGRPLTRVRLASEHGTTTAAAGFAVCRLEIAPVTRGAR